MTEEIKKTLSAMKGTSLIFNELTDQEIELISPFFEQKLYSAGSYLFREGEPSTFISFIVSGKFEMKKQTEIPARSIVLARLASGSFTGETTLLDGPQMRAVSVSAIEDSEVLILNKSDLEHITLEYPEIGVKILKELSRILTIRLLKAIEKITRTF